MSVSTLTMAAGRDRTRALSADVRGDARSRARRGVAGADGRDAHPVPRADDPGDPRRAEPAARSSPAPRPTQSPHCSAQLATDCCCTHYSTPSSTWPPRLTHSALLAPRPPRSRSATTAAGVAVLPPAFTSPVRRQSVAVHPHPERPDLEATDALPSATPARTDRRFAFTLRSRSVTAARSLVSAVTVCPPGGFARQAELLQVELSYRAAPAMYAETI